MCVCLAPLISNLFVPSWKSVVKNKPGSQWDHWANMRLSMGLCWEKVWIASFGSGQIGPHAPYEEQGLFLLTNKSALAIPLFKHRNTSWQRDCLYGLTYYWMAVLKSQGLLGIKNTFNMNIDSVQEKLINSVYKNVRTVSHKPSMTSHCVPKYVFVN